MLVLDLPAPACIHGFGGCIGKDGLVRARPAPDDGAIAKKRVLIIAKGLAEGSSEQLGTKPGRVQVKVAGDAITAFRDEGSDSGGSLLRAHSGVGDDDTLVPASVFQPTDQLLVLDVERVIVVKLRQSVRPSREDLLVRHKGGGLAEPRRFIGIIEAVVPRKARQTLFEFVRKSVVELSPRPPQEADSHFPRWLRFLIEIPRLHFQVFEEVPGENHRCSFSHADNADVRAANNPNGELWHLSLQRERSHQTCAAGAENDDRGDFHAVADLTCWTVGWATLVFPSPQPSSG